MLDHTSDKLPPPRIGEVVLRTGRYAGMKDWYRTILRVEPYFERIEVNSASAPGSGGQAWAAQVRLCFFRLVLDHPHQQVVAIFDVPGVGDASSASAGLHHVQLRDPCGEVLAHRYSTLKAAGIEPFRAMDHGPNTSLYYHDPDGNTVELAAPNYVEVAAYLNSLASEAFKANPSGLPLDLAGFAERFPVTRQNRRSGLVGPAES